MGKHKEKSKKSKKEKKHKRKSHNSSNSSEDEWIEKKSKTSSNSDDEQFEKPKRDEWMSLSTSFSSVSHLEKRAEREQQKRIDKEKEQYDPRYCSRELNPYWKDGGDGLPKFKKPSDDLYGSGSSKNKSYSSGSWRKRNPEMDHQKIESSNNVSNNDVSEESLNSISAKILKYELMGNTKLVKELKEKLDYLRNIKKCKTTENILLTQSDSKGHVRPVKSFHSGYNHPYKNKKKKIETHKDGERIKYFPDDDKYSLQQMFENEKYNTADDENREFIKIAGKLRKNDDMDDIFTDNIRKEQSTSKTDSINRSKAIAEHKKLSSSLDHCKYCLQSDLMLKHLMVSMGETVYLSLPSYEPLTKGHCLLTPVRHVSCGTQLDENEWAELMDFRKALSRMFLSQDEDVIFFEIAMNLHKYPHMVLQCVPLPKEEGDMAPIYFKKAIDESEYEWAQNKKLVSMKGKDVRRVIPKGFPYFCVSFGMEEGYAHVIEDEKLFPINFAQEIIGGMLDLHHSKWRKPKNTNLEEQNQRTLEFSKDWSQFDCTIKT